MTFFAVASMRGLTLIELMIAISIAALLAVTGLPFFGDYVANSRLREGGNSLMTDALFAQVEAIKRNGSVVVELSDTTLQVIDRSGDTDRVLRTRTMPEGISFGTQQLAFGSTGRPMPLKDSTINLSLAGATCSADVRCPAVRVDAGGAVQLCRDRRLGCK